jgi:hypothetical protein
MMVDIKLFYSQTNKNVIRFLKNYFRNWYIKKKQFPIKLVTFNITFLSFIKLNINYNSWHSHLICNNTFISVIKTKYNEVMQFTFESKWSFTGKFKANGKMWKFIRERQHYFKFHDYYCIVLVLILKNLIKNGRFDSYDNTFIIW